MPKLRVVLVGNPNVGKTSLLNYLAGASLKIGNFPGVTVEKKEGLRCYQDYEIEIVDLPGVYTIEFYTAEDERVTVDYLREGAYDLILNVIESPKLERDLFLTLQLAQLGKPMVIALNMSDEAEALGYKINGERLAEIFKVPVTKTNGKRGEGIDELLEAILEAYKKKLIPNLSQTRTQIVSLAEASYPDYISLAQGIAKEIAQKKLLTKQGLTNFLDALFLHPFFGFLFLLLIGYFLFKTVFDFSTPLVDFLDGFISDFLEPALAHLLSNLAIPGFLRNFISGALLGGVGTVLTFVPVIFFMFLALTLLETSGYLPRVAFLMDRFTHKIGLHGPSVVPLLLGFGCNVPALLALRVLSDPKDRLVVMGMIPFMPCSARLVVFAFFATLIFRNPFLIISFLYFLGLVVALFTAYLLRKKVYPKEFSHFVMDLPPYRLPSGWMLLRIVWVHLRSFLYRAGTVIFAISLLLWLLLNLPFGEKNLENTYAGRIGKFLSPIFTPLGLSDWRVTTSLIPAILAREAILSTLAVILEEERSKENKIFDLDSALKNQGRALGQALERAFLSFLKPYPSLFSPDEEEFSSLKGRIRGLFNQAQAFSFLVFILIYTSCLATLATIWREAGKKYALLFLLSSFILAYLLSTLTYQILRI